MPSFPIKEDAESFILLGHDCPLGQYPSIVVPVGRLDEQLVVVYSSSKGHEFVPIAPRSSYVKHSDETSRRLAHFDHRRDGLFALGNQSVSTYALGLERIFFASLLRSEAWKGLDHFHRFSLAVESGDKDLLGTAFDICVQQLEMGHPVVLGQWVSANRFANGRDLASQGTAPGSETEVDSKFPASIALSDSPYPFAVLRQHDDLGFVEYDIVAPPRRFFAGIDVIPSAVDIGVDKRRTQLTARPSQLLNKAPTEGDNWPAHTRRTLAMMFAWFLICEDPQRRLEAREVETLAHQASLVRHILDSPSLTRVLIADEVGLGKTVEAGLIISELLDRTPGLRVLYLAPARLVSNVHREFKRLGLYFRQWTANEQSDANLDDDRIVASIHKAAFVNNSERLLDARSWDVLVVDECHHLSSYGPDASKPVRQYALVQKLIQKRPDGRVLLMSGTPNQGNPERFDNLLRLLRKGDEPETSLAGRVIYRTKEDVIGWRNEPLFPLREVNSPRIIPLIAPYEKWLEEIYRFYVPDDSMQASRSRSAQRRAAGWRCSQALQWAASSVQAGVGYLVRQALRLGWGLEAKELEAAIVAIRPYRLGSAEETPRALFERMLREIKQPKDDNEDDEDDLQLDSQWSPDAQQLSTLLSQGVQLLKEVADTKWEFIWDNILSGVGMEQVVLFAQPIETVTALSNYLAKKTGFTPALIIGGQTDFEREQHVRRFWQGETQFLISSRAGSEGINLQCARRLVHVDVPWNPMEMEQRVGRVHRFGSQETIIVDTVVLEKTREERAYAVAYEKLRNVAWTLTTDRERFEELFARVMSLIPPAELQEVMTQAGVGDLSSDDHDKIADLVETGFKNWRRFHDRFHAEKRLRVPEPGQATWEDLEWFLKQYVKAKPVEGFKTLRFERRDKKQVESVFEEIPVLELSDGTLVCTADVGGRPIAGSRSNEVRPAGLNIPLIASTLRSVAFPNISSGAAYLRWSDSTPKPDVIPSGTIGFVGLVRMAVRKDLNSGWVEHKSEFHLWLVPKNGGTFELSGERMAQAVRSLIGATVRSRIEMDTKLAAQMASVETDLIDHYRTRTPEDLDSGLRFAVFPICSIVVSE